MREEEPPTPARKSHAARHYALEDDALMSTAASSSRRHRSRSRRRERDRSRNRSEKEPLYRGTSRGTSRGHRDGSHRDHGRDRGRDRRHQATVNSYTLTTHPDSPTPTNAFPSFSVSSPTSSTGAQKRHYPRKHTDISDLPSESTNDSGIIERVQEQIARANRMARKRDPEGDVTMNENESLRRKSSSAYSDEKQRSRSKSRHHHQTSGREKKKPEGMSSNYHHHNHNRSVSSVHSSTMSLLSAAGGGGGGDNDITNHAETTRISFYGDETLLDLDTTATPNPARIGYSMSRRQRRLQGRRTPQEPPMEERRDDVAVMTMRIHEEEQYVATTTRKDDDGKRPDKKKKRDKHRHQSSTTSRDAEGSYKTEQHREHSRHSGHRRHTRSSQKEEPSPAGTAGVISLHSMKIGSNASVTGIQEIPGKQRSAMDARGDEEDVMSASSFSTGILTTNTTKELHLQPLRWTDQETDNLLAQLEFFGESLGSTEEGQHFSKHKVEKLLDSIHALVEKDSLQRDDPIFQNLSKAINSIRLVDLDKLLDLLQEQHKAGNRMENKNVMLLCGPSGSGKTTTLHFLAGTTLEEVEEQGFFHLKPVHVQDPNLKDCETSCYRKHVTKWLQAATVQSTESNGESIDVVVCDTPSFGQFESVEEELSIGLAMVSEIQRAQSVHPVLVLSREAMGSRFGNLLEILHDLQGQFVLESKADFTPLNYLFTKYDSKYRSRIHKQLAVLDKATPEEVPDEDRIIFKAFVKDMMKKTTPKASVVLPMEDNPVRYLRDLFKEVSTRDGKELLVPSASVEAKQKFKMQLQLTVHDCTNLLTKGDYPLALHRLTQLKDIAAILPEAKDCAEKAQEAAVKHVALVAGLIKELIDEEDFATAAFRLNELSKLDKAIPEAEHAHERTLKKLRKRVKQMVEEAPIAISLGKLENLGKLSRRVPLADEFVQQGFDTILKSILRTLESQDLDEAAKQLVSLSALAKKLPEAAECAHHAFSTLKQVMKGLVIGYNFDSLADFLLELGTVASISDDAKDCIQIGFDSLRTRAMSQGYSTNGNQFIEQIRKLSKLTLYLPDEHAFLHRGKRLLNDTMEEIVENKDFNSVVDFILNLQRDDNIPSDAIECIQGGISTLLQKAVSSVDEFNYEKALAMLTKSCQLLPDVTVADDCIEAGLQDFSKNVQVTVTALELKQSVSLLEDIYSISRSFQKLKEGVEAGFESLLQQATTMLYEDKDRDRALSQFEYVGKLVQKLSISNECVERGLKDVNSSVQNILAVADFHKNIDLLVSLNSLRELDPVFSKCVNDGFVLLMQQSGKTMTANDCTRALSQIEVIGKIKGKLVLSEDTIERSIKEFSSTLNKFLDFMDFKKAMGTLQQVSELSRSFREVELCVRQGFELLLEKAVDTFSRRNYSQSLNEMKELGTLIKKLSLPSECTKGCFEYLETLIPGAIEDLPVVNSIDTLQELATLSPLLPESMACIKSAFDIIFKKVLEEITEVNYGQSFIQLKRLAKAVQPVKELSNLQGAETENLVTAVLNATQRMNFEKAEKLLMELQVVTDSFPQVHEALQAGFTWLLESTVSVVETEGVIKGIDQLQELRNLQAQLKIEENEVRDSTRRVLHHLSDAVQKNVERLEFGKAIKFLQDLSDTVKTYQEAKASVEAGFQSLVERVLKTFEEDYSLEGVEELRQLSLLWQQIDIDDQSRFGLEELPTITQKAFKQLNLKDLTQLIAKFQKLSNQLPEARECVEAGLKALWSRFEYAVTENEFYDAGSILQELTAFQLELPSLIEKYLHKGIELVRSLQEESGEEHDEELAEVMQKIELSLADPDGKFQQRGEELKTQMEKKLEDKKYSEAANMINELATEISRRVPYAKEYAQHGFRLAKQSMDTSASRGDLTNVLVIVKDFSKLAPVSFEASQCVEHGVGLLKSQLEADIENYRFAKALRLLEDIHTEAARSRKLRELIQNGMSQMGKTVEKPVSSDQQAERSDVILRLSRSKLPKALDCARRGLKGLWMTVKQSIEDQSYSDAISLMQNMRDLASSLPEAGDCVQLAFVALRVRLVKAIDKENYDVAMELMQQLCALAEDLPEAFECAQFGFETLRERLLKSIEEKNYSQAMEQMKQMGKMPKDMPEVIEIYVAAFSALSEAISRLIDAGDYKRALDVMRKQAEFSKVQQGAMDCVRKGLFSFWSAFEDYIVKESYQKAIRVLQYLGEMAQDSSEAEDGMHLGFEVLEEKFEAMLERKKYERAISLINDLSDLADKLPDASSSIQNKVEMLRERLMKEIEKQDYKRAGALIEKLERKVPRSAAVSPSTTKYTEDDTMDDPLESKESLVTSDSHTMETNNVTNQDIAQSSKASVGISVWSQSIETGIEEGNEDVEGLREKIARTMEAEQYGATLDFMVALSKTNQIVATEEALEFGSSLIKERLSLLIEKMKCPMILNLIRTLNISQTYDLPVATDCILFGLKELSKAIENRVDSREYKFAIDLIDLLCMLSPELVEAADCAQIGLDCAIQHMVLLREEASAFMDAVAEVKEETVFAKMLGTANENLQAIEKAEELRSFCDDLDNLTLGPRDDPRTLECTVKLESSEAFCTAQVHNIIECVASSFPELMVDEEYINIVVGNEDDLLSVFGRLAELHRVLSPYPGATEATVGAYRASFEKFYTFLDGVISLAQTESMPKMNLKPFETQLSLASFLIEGYSEDSKSIIKEDSKMIDDLEQRRARLMLRFEIEVTDAMEVLTNYVFPSSIEEDEAEKRSSYIRTMHISQVQKHREILSACVNLKDLAAIVAIKVDVLDASKCLESFDESLDSLLEQLVSKLDEELGKLQASPKPSPDVKEKTKALGQDVVSLTGEVSKICSWSTPFSGDTAAYLKRLQDLDERTKELTFQFEETSKSGIGTFFSSFTNILPDPSEMSLFNCAKSAFSKNQEDEKPETS